MEKEVIFYSEGYRLNGTICFPDKNHEGKKYPAIIMSHGYGANRDELGDFSFLAKKFAEEGFASLRFDCRGCGFSQFPLGRMFCDSDWCQDLISAVYFCMAFPGIEPARIGLFGESMGGANVLAASAMEDVSRCVVSLSPIADGFKWVQNNWLKNYLVKDFTEFLEKVNEDATRQSIYGRSNLVKMKDALGYEQRYVDLIESLKNQFTDHEFTYYVELASIKSVMQLKPLKKVEKIAPKPLLLMAGAKDKMVPWEENAKLLFDRAKDIKKLEIFDSGDHSLLAEPTRTEALDRIINWYKKYL